MRARVLELENFRNYSSLQLSFSPGVNVFFGNNGQGKTNIIEAIYMCACARSHRTAKDEELIKHGENYYYISLDYTEKNDIDEQVGMKYQILPSVTNNSKQKQRTLYRDNLALDRVMDFVGIFNAVIFAPEDLQIVKGGPGERRRFMDLLLSQVKPVYFQALQEFGKILRQRNALLKTYKEKGRKLSSLETAQLDIWDDVYAAKAAFIILERLQLVEKLSAISCQIHQNISDGLERSEIRYKTVSGIDESLDQEAIQEVILRKLNANREQDIFRGYTSLGPHRDDLDISLNDLPLKIYGSQGQQRTFVLALKMAELKVIEEITRQAPVLLLDDIMSELDGKRRKQLVTSLENIQIFITCTDPDQLDKDWLKSLGSEEIYYFKVNQAQVEFQKEK